MRLTVLCAGLVLASGCTTNLTPEPGVLIECGDDGDCPDGYRCRPQDRLCTDSDNDSPSVTIEPIDRFIGSTTLVLRVSDTEAEPVRLDISLVDGATRTPLQLATAGLSSRFDGVEHHINWDATGVLPGDNYRDALHLELIPNDGTSTGQTVTSVEFGYGNNAPTVTAALGVQGDLSGAVPMTLVAQDDQGDHADIELRFREDGGAWRAMDVLGELIGVATSTTGASYLVVWKSESAPDPDATVPQGIGLNNASNLDIEARVADHPFDDTRYESAWVSVGTGLTVTNNAAPVASVLNMPRAPGADVHLIWSVFDPEGDPINALVEYRTDGDVWRPATPGLGSDGTYAMATTTSGLPLPHTFVWDAKVDIGIAAGVQLRVTPSDSTNTGIAAISPLEIARTGWSKVTEAPEGELGAMTSDGEILYVIIDLTFVKRLYSFDIQTGAWRYLSDVPSIGYPVLAVAGNRLAVVSNCGFGCAGDFHWYELQTDTWTYVSEHPEALNQSTGTLTVFDGQPVVHTLEDTFTMQPEALNRFNTTDDSWMPLPFPPEVVLGYAGLGDTLYATSDTTVYAYSLSDPTWRSVHSIPSDRRASLRPNTGSSSLYLLASSTRQVERFTPGGSWQSLSPAGHVFGVSQVVEVAGSLLTRVGSELYRLGLGAELPHNQQLPRGLSNGEAVVVNGVLYIVGGRDYAGDSVTSLHRQNIDGTWTQLDDMNVARGNFAAAAVGNGIYVAGGFTMTSNSLGFLGYSAEYYDVRTNSWIPISEIPSSTDPPDGNDVGLADCRGFGMGGEFFVVGGRAQFGSFGNRQLAVYNSSSGWGLRAPMSVRRMSPAVAVHDNYAYVFGGLGETAVLNSVERYDAGTDTWTDMPPMPFPDFYLRAATLGDIIYVTGGYDGAGRVAAFDTRDQTWRELPRLSLALDEPAVAAFDDRVWILGGRGDGYTTDPILYLTESTALSLRAASLEPIGNGTVSLEFASATASDTTLFVAGGLDATGTTSSSVWMHRYLDGTWDAGEWTANAPYRGGEWLILTDAPEPVAGASLHLRSDVLYLLGGMRSGFASQAADFYDTATGTWSSGPDLTEARAHFGTAELNGEIIIAGGTDGTSASATVWSYDGVSTPSALSSLPEARSHLACVTRKQALYCAGGEDTSGVRRASVYVLSLSGWVEAAPLPLPVRDGALLDVGGLVYAGGDTDAGPSQQVWLYSEAADSWSSIGGLDVPRSAAAAAASGGRAHIVGGRTATGLTDGQEVLGLH